MDQRQFADPPCCVGKITVPRLDAGKRLSWGAPTRQGSPPPRSSWLKYLYSAVRSRQRPTTVPHFRHVLTSRCSHSSNLESHVGQSVTMVEGIVWESSHAELRYWVRLVILDASFKHGVLFQFLKLYRMTETWIKIYY